MALKEVKEIKVDNVTAYLVKDNNEGEQRIICNKFHIDRTGDKTVIVFNGGNLNNIKEFNDFSNYLGIAEASLSFIKNTCFNLKVLANFLEIYELEVKDMADENNISDFISFIKGLLPNTDCSKRTNPSCHNILISVRKFLQWENINTTIYDKDCFQNGYQFAFFAKNNTQERMDYIDKDNLLKLKEVIIHAKPCYTARFRDAKKKIDDEYKNKLKRTKRKADTKNLNKAITLPSFDEQAYVIFRLECNRGLRLGEILGLTCEDVKIIKGAKGSIRKGIYLRNRLSDHDYQYCKEVIHPKTLKDYESADYNKIGVGYNFVDIDDVTWTLLQNIINRDLPVYDKAYPDKAEENKADCVSGEGSNAYIFRTSHGGRLSDQAWNKRLRSYFITAGLPVDKGKKETNLNLRLRNSFAMLLLNNNRINPAWLSALLRNKSIKSVKKYYNTEEYKASDFYEDFFKEEFSGNNTESE